MQGTYIKRSKPVLPELHCVMLETTFMDCSPTNAVSLLTNRLKLKRFWAYRSDSKDFSKLLSLRNLQEVFEQSVGSINIQIYRHPRYIATNFVEHTVVL